MATLVQSRSVSAASSTSGSLAFSNPVTAGNLLVCCVSQANTGGTFTISDGINGSYHIDATPQGNSGSIVIASFTNTGGGTPTVSWSESGAASAQARQTIQEWSGIASALALDQTGSATFASSGVPTVSTSGSTVQAVEVAVVAASFPNSAETITALTNGFQLDPNSLANGSSSDRLAVAYLVTSSSGVQSTQLTLGTSSSSVLAIATYKSPAALGPQNQLMMHRRYVPIIESR